MKQGRAFRAKINGIVQGPPTSIAGIRMNKILIFIIIVAQKQGMGVLELFNMSMTMFRYQTSTMKIYHKLALKTMVGKTVPPLATDAADELSVI